LHRTPAHNRDSHRHRSERVESCLLTSQRKGGGGGSVRAWPHCWPQRYYSAAGDSLKIARYPCSFSSRPPI
jgi:hypothetical protein